MSGGIQDRQIDQFLRAAAEESSQNKSGLLLDGRRIFIMEDDMDAMIIASRLLQIAGARVSFERHGYITLAMVKRSLPLDLIILDLNVPGTDGFTTLSQLRAEKAYSHIKVICSTAQADKIGQAKQLGFDGFIAKPLAPDRFAKQVAAVINGESVWVTS